MARILHARQRIASEAKRAQPHWASPLVVTSPRLSEGLRTDFIRQSASGGRTNWNLGGSKGFQFIPYRRLELRVTPPPFLMHSGRNSRDGFGDVQFRLKSVLYVSNEKHHDAMISASLNSSVPTGKNGNGSCCASVTPTLIAGKGLGRFAVISSLGGNLPVSNTANLGRTIVFNTAMEYRVKGPVWLESEANATYFHGGRNDRKEQVFLTPGILMNSVHLCHAGGSCPNLTLGAAEQIAVSSFYAYNHGLVFTGRLRF